MKAVKLSAHALERCRERGAEESEVTAAIEWGPREPARHGRMLCRLTFPFGGVWRGKPYAEKQVAAVIEETPTDIVVITVIAHYF